MVVILNRDSFITVLSTRKSGKSFLVSQLIHTFLTNSPENRCDVIYMFSNTAKFEASGHYNFLDKRCIFPASHEIVDRVTNRLFEIQKKSKNKHHILVVFDDIDLSRKYEQSIDKIAYQGRHYGITCILSAQIATCAVSPAIRNNTTYLFFRKLMADVLKRLIYQMVYNRDFNSAEEFKEYVYENIEDYQFIFYDNDSDEKTLKIVKADPIPTDFKYKCKEQKKPAGKKVKFTTDVPLYTGNLKKYNQGQDIKNDQKP